MSASGDDQLAALREQRRMELQRQLESQAQAEAEMETHRKNAESQAVSNAMKQLLTSEARARLARISLATPERAEAIRRMVIELNNNNKFVPPMNDEKLKSILASQSKSRNNASIRRI